MLGWLAKLLGGNILDRVLSTVDKHVESQTDRERIKANLIAEHLRTRADFMRAGGFWLMLIFALPLAVWWAAVILYSILWCARCAYPQAWSIAALPSPLDTWSGAMITAVFGVVGLSNLRR